jgi:hypothetical protein
MRTASFVTLAMMLVAGSAFAGGGAQEPQTSEGGPPSGRSGPVVDEAKCEAVWKSITEEGEVSADKVAPFIVNLEMVDTNKDGEVSDGEFKQGCEKGWVQEKPSKPADASGGGQTPEQPQSPQP